MNSKTTTNIVAFPQQFIDNSRGPIRFGDLWPGSTFRIVAEPSRGIYRSKDKAVYKKDERFFYSTEVGNPDHNIVLMPQDLVMPMIRDKGQARRPVKKNTKVA